MMFFEVEYFSPPGTNFPISSKELLRRTGWTFISNLSTMFKIAITTFVPAQIIIAIVGHYILPHVQRLAGYDPEVETDDIRPHLLSTFLYVLALDSIGYLVYGISELAIIEVAKDTHAGRSVKTSFADAMEAVLFALFTGLTVIFVTNVLSNLAIVLLIIPKLYLDLSWWVATCAVVVERAGVCDAMQRSWYLTSGFRCELCKIYVSYLLGYYVCIIGINAICIITFTIYPIRYVLGYCLPVLFFRPFGFILKTVVYFDLRARKESLTRRKLVDEIETGIRDVSGLGGIMGEMAEEEEEMMMERSMGINPAWETVQSEPLNDGMWDQKDEKAEKFGHFEMT